MGGKIDEWVGGGVDGWVGGYNYGWMDWIGGQMDRQLNGLMGQGYGCCCLLACSDLQWGNLFLADDPMAPITVYHNTVNAPDHFSVYFTSSCVFSWIIPYCRGVTSTNGCLYLQLKVKPECCLYC